MSLHLLPSTLLSSHCLTFIFHSSSYEILCLLYMLAACTQFNKINQILFMQRHFCSAIQNVLQSKVTLGTDDARLSMLCTQLNNKIEY